MCQVQDVLSLLRIGILQARWRCSSCGFPYSRRAWWSCSPAASPADGPPGWRSSRPSWPSTCASCSAPVNWCVFVCLVWSGGGNVVVWWWFVCDVRLWVWRERSQGQRGKQMWSMYKRFSNCLKCQTSSSEDLWIFVFFSPSAHESRVCILAYWEQIPQTALRSRVIISILWLFLRSAMLQLALSNLWEARAVILPINQHLHFLKENFVLLVSAPPLHLVIQLGDDLVLKLQLDRAGVNNQCS